jgi:hypothetical protein
MDIQNSNLKVANLLNTLKDCNVSYHQSHLQCFNQLLTSLDIGYLYRILRVYKGVQYGRTDTRNVYFTNTDVRIL